MSDDNGIAGAVLFGTGTVTFNRPHVLTLPSGERVFVPAGSRIEEHGSTGAGPVVGDSVRYQAFGTPGGEYQPVPRLAFVTDVGVGGYVSLCVVNPTGLFFPIRVRFDDSAKPDGGTWHWPPPRAAT